MTLMLGFSPETFEGRRARARRALGRDVLVLPSAPVLKRSRDTEYRYRPDSELFYLTGSLEPGVVAVLAGKEEGGFVLFVPERDRDAERWDGPRMGPGETGELLGADTVYPLRELEERLPELLKASSRIFFRLGSDARVESLVREALRWARSRGTRRGEGPRAVVDPGQILDDFRLVKDAGEVDRMRRSASVTVSAFRGAAGALRHGMGEWEVEAILESGFRRGGGSGPAFPTIAASGGNACILHYVENCNRLEHGRLVLLDGGAELDLYASDVTRTFPVGGRFTGAQRAVYDIVRSAHGNALDMLGPGIPLEVVHHTVVETLTKGLLEMGVLRGSLEEAFQTRAYEPFCPHRAFHWLGMDVHDVGDYAAAGQSRLLEPGMALTLEPGLYFPHDETGESQAFRGIGVRIEDDLLITHGGVENLTEGLPVAPGEVEDLAGSSFEA